MRPLKPGARYEPKLTRDARAELDDLYPEPPLRRAEPAYPPLSLREDELRRGSAAAEDLRRAPALAEDREPPRAFARLERSEPSLTRTASGAAAPAPSSQGASASRPNRLFSAPPPVLAEPASQTLRPYEGQGAAPEPRAEAPRKRLGIPLRWLETRGETKARKERERQEAADLADLTAYSAEDAAPAEPSPLRFGGEPPLRVDPRPGASADAAARAWVGAAPPPAAPPRAAAPAQPVGRTVFERPEPTLRAAPAQGSDDVWSPVLPGHSSPRAEPTLFRSPELPGPRGLAVFGPASEQAVAAARYWPKDPRPDERLEPANSTRSPADEDEEDDFFRPWLHPDPTAEGWSVAVPGLCGSGISVSETRRRAPEPMPATAGPWDAEAAPVPMISPVGDEPGWDQFYAEAEDERRPAAPVAGFAAVEDVPEAPMIEAHAPKRRSFRRDPAPSRTAYRLQRLWLTPLYRALLRKGLPAFVLVFACGVALQDEGRREALVTWANDLRATITERPEFMLSELKIEGASVETAEAVKAALAVQFPVSSFDLELPVLQEKAAEVTAVASAALHVRSGGVLEVLVEERKPVVVWRSETGIGTLDPTGHQVASLQNRLERPDLPLIVGLGADRAVPEALRLYHAAGPIRDRVRGLIRVGERRWDLVVHPAIRVMLPAKDPVPALEQVVALHQAQDLLDRDITAVDLRNPARATVRMGEPAAETWRLNLAAQKGK